MICCLMYPEPQTGLSRCILMSSLYTSSSKTSDTGFSRFSTNLSNFMQIFWKLEPAQINKSPFYFLLISPVVVPRAETNTRVGQQDLQELCFASQHPSKQSLHCWSWCLDPPEDRPAESTYIPTHFSWRPTSVVSSRVHPSGLSQFCSYWEEAADVLHRSQREQITEVFSQFPLLSRMFGSTRSSLISDQWSVPSCSELKFVLIAIISGEVHCSLTQSWPIP